MDIPKLSSKCMIKLAQEHAHMFTSLTEDKCKLLVKVDNYIVDSGEFETENAAAFSVIVGKKISNEKAMLLIESVLKDFALVAISYDEE